MRTGYIPVTGGRVWYKTVGENKETIPLLVLHGGPGATHEYMQPLEILADERPVIFYDQLGGGNSDRPKDASLWTVERFVEELAQVRNSLNLGKVHILGQSWGTMLAVSYIASLKPEGVISLIFSGAAFSAKRFTEDTRGYLKELPENDRRVIEKSEREGRFDSKEYRDAMMNFYKLHVCRLDPWPDCLNRTFENMGLDVYNHMWGASEFSVTGTLKDFDVTDKLKEIEAPVLLTCGRYDEASPETTSYYNGLIPRSEMVVFEDASHEHHLEKTEEYIKVLRDFLKRVEE
ncbi:MAG: proline iminopeptidase-family hydrolase [Candidatus Omnitrophica bacterium]|nr:proline iminopeptidase-family hydrolase [Candidatus Omnitrophota bacterium]